MIQIHLNGLLMVEGADYTLTGEYPIFTSAPRESDVIQVTKFSGGAVTTYRISSEPVKTVEKYLKTATKNGTSISTLRNAIINNPFLDNFERIKLLKKYNLQKKGDIDND